MRPAWRTALLAALLCLLVPAIARADFSALYRDYAADQVIDGCKYSPAELRAGLGQIPADVRQYDPGFETALQSALEQRAAGCGAAASAPARGDGLTTAADGSPGPKSVTAAQLPSAPQGHGVPAVVVAMIVLLGVVLLVAATLGLAIYFGWNLDAALGPAVNAGRGFGERVSDRLYAVRDRLGF